MPIGSIIGGVFGGLGSIFGANAQASASKYAANLEYQSEQNALGFEEQQWNTTQANQAPFLKAGQGAIGNLSNWLTESAAGTGPLAPWTGTFTAPTAAQAEATPGYQFELSQGLDAVQRSAAASGGLETGGNIKATTDYAEGVASTNYQQAFQNALTQYQTAYNTFQNNQNNLFNRTASVAGAGQTSAAQLGQTAAQTGSTVANTFLSGGAQIGQDIQNAGSATASGYAGAANAITGGINNASALAMLQQILQQNNGDFTAPGSLSQWAQTPSK